MLGKCASAALALVLLACKGSVPQPPLALPGTCSGDSECGTNFRCDHEMRRCVCTSDAACPGKFCNAFTGLCVETVGGCTSNSSCGAGQYCNTAVRSCRKIAPFCQPCGSDNECGKGGSCAAHPDFPSAGSFCVAACDAAGSCANGLTCRKSQAGASLCYPAGACGVSNACIPDSLKLCARRTPTARAARSARATPTARRAAAPAASPTPTARWGRAAAPPTRRIRVARRAAPRTRTARSTPSAREGCASRPRRAARRRPARTPPSAQWARLASTTAAWAPICRNTCGESVCGACPVASPWCTVKCAASCFPMNLGPCSSLAQCTGKGFPADVVCNTQVGQCQAWGHLLPCNSSADCPMKGFKCLPNADLNCPGTGNLCFPTEQAAQAACGLGHP